MKHWSYRESQEHNRRVEEALSFIGVVLMMAVIVLCCMFGD